MQELLKNAWLGWENYTGNGKYAALLLAALLFLWLKYKGKGQHALVLYATVIAGCCIFPVSAVLLMLYQTKFYDYEWIWNLVPVTLIIAFAGTLFLSEILTAQDARILKSPVWGKWQNVGKKSCVVLAVIALIVLCGRMGSKVWDADTENRNYAETKEILFAVTDGGQNKDICLFAPQAIMEHAREIDGSVRLLYGRNMWDRALNAYSYDVYDQDTMNLYQWMSSLEQTGEADTAYIAQAVEKGANRIVLPGTVKPEVLAEIEMLLGTEAKQQGSLYLLEIQ